MTFYYDTDDYVDILKSQVNCNHSWVAGMMVVNDEDLEYVAQRRAVECEKCEKVYNANAGEAAFSMDKFFKEYGSDN